MLLAVTSFGVAYFLIDFYSIELGWLNTESRFWGVDSWRFFREMYPLAAGVVLISLFAYFMIASSVRKYKFYLNSGQDYRKMISLAESIDDLTNPAQIAKLSNYPELQNVLRNYGDQIKEISQQMDERVDGGKSVDLEMEIDSILKGNKVQETLAEGKWWASLARKVSDYVSSQEGRVEGIRGRSETGRQVAGMVALSFGRLAEQFDGSSESLGEIVKATGMLNNVIGSLDPGQSPGGPATADPGAAGVAANMDGALQRLVASGQTIHSFAEENNSLALNIALMAARGDVTEQDLAQFAERVRSIAEGFNKLERDLHQTTSVLAQSIDVIRGGAGSGPSQGANNSAVRQSLAQISGQIEGACSSLRDKITTVKGELDTLNQDLHRAVSEGQGGDEADSAGESRETSDFVSFASDDASDGQRQVSSDGLVVDHGGSWDDTHTGADQTQPAEDVKEAAAADEKSIDLGGFSEHVDLASGSGTPQASAAPAVEEPVEEGGLNVSFAAVQGTPGIEEELQAPQQETPAIREETQLPPQGEAGVQAGAQAPPAGEDWMEMPGRKWMKIDADAGETPSAIQYPEDAPVQQEVPVQAQPAMPETGMAEGTAESAEKEYVIDEPAVEAPPQVFEQAAAAEENMPAGTDEAVAGDGEPVYDLNELGAVEYKE